MTKIEMTSPFEIDGKTVTALTISPTSFVKFAEAIEQASSNPETFRVDLQRARLMAQTTAWFGDTASPIQEQDIVRLPIAEARLLVAALDATTTEAGEVITAGDGIENAILYKLGTPITTSDGEITELEFLAKVYGDIEDVLAQTTTPEQTVALIKMVAKPIGNGATGLLRLPDWALDHISQADGLEIMGSVLPSFLA